MNKDPQQYDKIRLGALKGNGHISPHWDDIRRRGMFWKKTKDTGAFPSEKEQEYWNRVNASHEYVENYVADPVQAYKIIRNRANSRLYDRNLKFVLDAENTEIIQQLCYYFTRNQNFKGVLSKGLCLMGGYGVGKTFLLSLFTNNWEDGLKFQDGFNWIITAERSIAIKEDPEGAEKYYGCGNIRGIFARQNVLLDELGGEITLSPAEIGKRSLTFKEVDMTGVVSSLLHERHKLFVTTGLITHLTTNITDGNSLATIYGAKIVSRLNEMCNILEISGPDRRK